MKFLSNLFKRTGNFVSSGSLELRMRFTAEGKRRILAVLDTSSHQNIAQLTAEAFKVSETVYQYGNKGHVVHCHIVNGKIEMYIDGPDDGGKKPVDEIRNDIWLQTQAA